MSFSRYRRPRRLDRVRTVWQSLVDHPSAVLLVAQLLAVVLFPFTSESSAGRLALSLLGLGVLGLAIAAVRRTPALNWVGILVGVPAILLTLAEVVRPDSAPIALASMIVHALFYFYVTYGLLAYMFADNWVTRDEVFATGATFTVACWAFAYTYGAVQIIWPGSFAHSGEGSLSWFELIFLSFTTMTGTGLSDIAPASNHARSFIILQEMAGMNYVALVVARLLGLTLAKFRR